MDAFHRRTMRLAVATAAALAMVGCGGRQPDAPDPDSAASPVADVEGTMLPPTVVASPGAPPARDLDWTVDGQERIASSSDDDATAAVRDFLGDEPTGGSPDARPTQGDATTTGSVATRESRADPPRAAAEEVQTAGSRADAARADRSIADAASPAAPPSTSASAVERDPSQARALNGRGIALIHAGRPGDAIPVLERAVALQPRDAELLGNLGYAYMLVGEHARARARLRTALDVAPTRSATWLNLGQTYAELGEREAGVDAVVRGYRYSTRKPSVLSALRRAVSGDRHSAAWREAAGMALERIEG